MPEVPLLLGMGDSVQGARRVLGVDFLDVGVVALLVLGYGVVSARLERSVVSGPMVFVAAGVLLGPAALDVVDVRVGDDVLRVLAELTLALLLFTDAARIDLRLLRRQHRVPVRLLGFGMPLNIAVGTLVGLALLRGVDLRQAALLAAIVAPTDAALSQGVMENPRLPPVVRQSLNVESGLNDGIAVPFVTLFGALVVSGAAVEGPGFWVGFVAEQMGFALLVGLIVGLLGGKFVQGAVAREWMSGTFEQLATLAIAVAAFAMAETVGGNGFIASFVAGLTVGSVLGGPTDRLLGFAEEEGQLLVLVTFFLFGSAVAGPALVEGVPWSTAGYVVSSLVAVRGVAMVVGVTGLGLRAPTKLFLGWFGPRGLASIVLGLMAVEEGIPGAEGLFAVVTWTVAASVFAHGLSSRPGAEAYARYCRRLAPDSAEHVEVDEMPLRMRRSS